MHQSVYNFKFSFLFISILYGFNGNEIESIHIQWPKPNERHSELASSTRSTKYRTHTTTKPSFGKSKLI